MGSIKGAKLKRDLQHVKDRRVVLKENLEQKMNRSKEKGNLNLSIKYEIRVLSYRKIKTISIRNFMIMIEMAIF